MVISEVSVPSLGDVAHVPQQNWECESDGYDASRQWQTCGSRVSSQKLILIHPTELLFQGNWRMQNEDLCYAFGSAALRELPVIEILEYLMHLLFDTDVS
eukprot:2107796-Rhodomonas_salina.2